MEKKRKHVTLRPNYTDMNERNVITLENIIHQVLNESVNYKNQVMISHIKDLSLFKTPCHLKAISILVCLNGELECSINLHTYKLGKNSVLIIFPENIIQLKSTKDLEAFAIILSSEFVRKLSLDPLSVSHLLAWDVTRKAKLELPEKEIDHLSHYLAILEKTMKSPFNDTSDNLMMYISSAFMDEIIQLHHHYQPAIAEDINGSKRKLNILDKFVELVGIYHSQERELKFYADKMCITPKYLADTVKNISGKKATEWICDFVIMEAQSLLRYSGLTVHEISEKLNFSSQSAFGKYFKYQVGVSPSEYQGRGQDEEK